MTTTYLAASDVDRYDYVIVGGGTAGCVIASRLSEYLPHKRVLLIEGGPSDFMDNRVLDLRQWLHLLGGELDYDYGTTEQPMGKLSNRAGGRPAPQIQDPCLTAWQATRTSGIPGRRFWAAAHRTTP
jgi:choline dehydrogenase-like flavoprotein